MKGRVFQYACFCPGGTSAISWWLSASDATGTEVVESDRSPRDRTLPGNDIVETTPQRRTSLESLRDSNIVDTFDSGGVASLNRFPQPKTHFATKI